MATTDLLTAVLAPEGEGWYCIVGLRQDGSKPPVQTFHATLVEVEAQIDVLLQDKCNVYFACAKYKDPKEGRIQPNTGMIKAFWLDIDCGEGKPYENQTEGLNALKSFCKKINMPLPSVVDSGRGIHAYWRLKTVVDRLQWKPVAERLKALCEEHDFAVLRSNNWDRYRPRAICVESHEPREKIEMEAYLKSKGYELVAQINHSLFFLAR